jgi:hypothetical protein
MSFQATPARSSRITKRRTQSAISALGLKRTTSGPASASPRRRSSQPNETSYNDDEKLDDTGVIASLAEDLNFRDVPQYMQYIRNTMFSDIPERAAGMNSTRIAEVLNFRLRLPPIVTIAHIDALSQSSTRMEREIVELAQAGILRRVIIPNRDVGSGAVGDGIASVLEWEKLVRSSPELDEELKCMFSFSASQYIIAYALIAKYISLMNTNPTSASVPGHAFTPVQLSTLVSAGFLTTASIPDSRSSLFASPGAGSQGSLAFLSSSGSRHAAGSLAAVGGAEAGRLIPGGLGSTGPRSSSSALYNFSLPNTGSHTKLLQAARTHLITLLKKTKYKEAPLTLLRERWDGGIPALDEQTKMKRARGEFANVLPGRTKKWKQFWGLRFEWILEECVGAGLVECFQTGSVGVGVRIT